MLFFLLLSAFIFLMLFKPVQKEAHARADDRLIDRRPKNCPPHKWAWVKVYNEDGTETGRERIVCSLCGPLRGSNEQ